MKRSMVMPLDVVQYWPTWFDADDCKVRLFKDDPSAIAELKAAIDPFWWSDEFVAYQFNGLIESSGQRVLLLVRERATQTPGTATVIAWPIPFEKGRRRDKEQLWEHVLDVLEEHGWAGKPQSWRAWLKSCFSRSRD